eukprot:3136077-Prymnesium_polylepis.1
MATRPPYEVFELTSHGRQTRERLSRPGETSRLNVPAFLHFGPAGTPVGGGVSFTEGGTVGGEGESCDDDEGEGVACPVCGEEEDEDGNDML